MELVIVWAVVFWIIPIFLAANIWEKKGGNTVPGVLLGVFLGWLGVLIAAIATPGNATPKALARQEEDKQKALQTTTRECPHCKSQMRRDASVCPHCQRESKAWVWHGERWWVTDDAGIYFWLDDERHQWVRHETVS